MLATALIELLKDAACCPLVTAAVIYLWACGALSQPR